MPDVAPDAPPRRDRLTPLAILAELAYPEYRSRHLFTARLRFLLFLGFVAFYLVTVGEHWFETRAVLIVLFSSFLVTAICYYNIIRDRWLVPSLVFEIVADLTTLTTIVYLTGGIDSEYYFVYLLYVLIAGLFYNHVVACITAVASFLAYLVFLGCSLVGWIPALLPDIPSADRLAIHHLHPHPAWGHPEWGHPVLLAALLVIAVYAVKIAQRFTLRREQMLEVRNRELLALQRIGGTVRGVAPLEQVVEQVLRGILEGLPFPFCLLLLYDQRGRKIRCYPPVGHPLMAPLERLLGRSLTDYYLPTEVLENQVFRQLSRKQVIFRKDLADLFIGVEPPIPPEQLRAITSLIGVRKVVAIPLVAEQAVLGALVGFAEEAYVDPRLVQTLETFANQGALAIQTTLLIEALKAKNRELEEANRVKSEFLATMSHELRTPLTAIIGFSELLLEGVMGELTEEQQESLREVLNNGANLLALINNLLDLAKMEAGKFPLVYEQFDLRLLLDRTLRTLHSLVQRKRLHVKGVLPNDLPPIEADERRIQQVVLNLLGNAIKFTPEGGEVRVEAGYHPALETLPFPDWADHVAEKAPFADGCFAIMVKDTGIGIPQTHLRSVFEMFRQVDSSVTRSYEGTGLGLALAKQLVELHRGAIWAESEAEAGATFICLLPSTAPKPPPPAAPPTPTPEPAPSRPAISPIRVPV